MVVKNSKNIFNLAIVITFLCIAIFPWSDFFKTGISISSMLQGPSPSHLLGTDNLGRDLLARIANAIRGAVLPLWLAVLIGSFLGILAGVYGILVGSYSKFSLSLVNSLRIVMVVFASVPVGVVAFAWAAYQERAGLQPVLFTLMILFSIRTFLQLLDLYSQDKNLAYWQVHQSIGGSLRERVVKYGILGRWRWDLIDTLCFHLQAAVTIEASLSYLGFGIQEPQASFGNILASHFSLMLKGEWGILIVVVAGLALSSAFPLGLARTVKYLSFKYSKLQNAVNH